jgi:heme A synthase
MRLSPPRRISWLAALFFLVVGIVAYLGYLPYLGGLSIWLVVISSVLLLLATLLNKL